MVFFYKCKGLENGVGVCTGNGDVHSLYVLLFSAKAIERPAYLIKNDEELLQRIFVSISFSVAASCMAELFMGANI
jgi:hypothetical protein